MQADGDCSSTTQNPPLLDYNCICEHTELMPPEALKTNHEAESPGCRSFPCLNKSKKVKNATDVVFAKTTLFVIMESEAVNLACLGDKRPFQKPKVRLYKHKLNFEAFPVG